MKRGHVFCTWMVPLSRKRVLTYSFFPLMIFFCARDHHGLVLLARNDLCESSRRFKSLWVYLYVGYVLLPTSEPAGFFEYGLYKIQILNFWTTKICGGTAFIVYDHGHGDCFCVVVCLHVVEWNHKIHHRSKKKTRKRYNRHSYLTR